jgi:hypothetical protein
MQSFNLYELKHCKFIGNKYDVIYKIYNYSKYTKGIQIKTLSKGTSINQWQISLAKCEYKQKYIVSSS